MKEKGVNYFFLLYAINLAGYRNKDETLERVRIADTRSNSKNDTIIDIKEGRRI